jgi:23S rRNA G2445 N2-methylase RlmL
MSTPLKEQIAAALKAFAPGGAKHPANLFEAGIGLFKTLGYDTSRQARLPDPTAAGFMADYVAPGEAFSTERARTAEWKTVELLFQLTQAEVINQVSLFDTRQVDRTRIETYLFWAIELTGDGYTRTDLAQMTRELNRLFPMPSLVLFRYSNCLTLAAINRRLNKRDERRDVLEKVTLVKSIQLDKPHPGHVTILHDLSFEELYQRHHFDSFVALHNAWQETLDIALLNKKFYRELYTWYEWAAHRESGVRFPRPASETAGLAGDELLQSEDAYRRLSLIRLLTRVIFVWFLREKDLVPDALFDTKKALPDTLKNFKATDPDSSAFYQGILQNLFFATLNTPMKRDVEARAKRGEKVDDGIRRFVVNGKRPGYSDDHTDQTKYRGEELFRDPAAALALFDSVPFLNGGLFECLDTRDDDQEVRFDGFSATVKNRATVPNILFFGEKKGLDLVQAFGGDKKQRKVNAQGLVLILEKYKFTIAENTPLEEEVALDPELLGKVFENLLATYNPETQTTARKQTGSFYTPREIVNYMVDESLKAYLAQALPASPAPDDRLSQLFDEARPDTENPFGAGSSETIVLVDALSRCRILDPACGSGAFPMGVLHRMVTLLRRLDPDNQRWRQTQLALAETKLTEAKAETDPEIRQNTVAAANQHMKVVLDSFQKDAEAAELSNAHLTEAQRRQNYARKLFLIENCIYGVDIQQIAVQIAKLRFFISLVAEQRVDDSQENRNILAMPNLETKFVAANTLVPLDRTGTLADGHSLVQLREKELQELRRQMFFVRRYTDKKHLRLREKAKRQQLREALETAGFSKSAAQQAANWSPLDVMHPASYFDAETMFDVKDGFDVVIGNPPYGAKISAEDKKMFLKQYKHQDYQLDTYLLFMEQGLRITKSGGTVAYIIPNTWLTNLKTKNIRKFLLKENTISSISHYHESVFEAVVDTQVVVVSKAKKKDNQVRLAFYQKDAINPTLIFAPQIKWAELNGEAINIFANSDELLVGEKLMLGTTQLENLCKITLGTKPFQVGKGRPPQTREVATEQTYVSKTKDDETFVPLLRGSLIKRYVTLWQDDYYISFGPWLAEPRESAGYDAVEKIVIRQTANELIATLDQKQFVVRNNMFTILQKQKEFDLKFVLALINSKLLSWYYQNFINNEVGEVFAEVKRGHLAQLPIKQINSLAQLPFIRLVEYILWLKEQNPADVRAQYLEQVLNGLVYELYFTAALVAAGCEVGRHLPALPPLPAAAGAAEQQLQTLYAAIEAKDHPVRKSLFLMNTVEEVAIIEGKRK